MVSHLAKAASTGRLSTLAILLLVGLTRSAPGQEPAWQPTFGAQPGVDSGVRALAVFDDGGGPALYAGGSFTSAGGVEADNIARWDGSDWSPLGVGAGDNVYALAVFDDGSGSALYAAGNFETAGGLPAPGIARWDGSTWSRVGAGIDEGSFRALAVFDDGSGPALHAAGTFTLSGLTTRGIARWDGTSWSRVGTLGPSTTAFVLALHVHDDGSGPGLYAAGKFSDVDGVAAANVARWDGLGWSAVGAGLGSQANALATHDDGSGPALYVGGSFWLTGDGQPASRVARWDGSRWSALGTGVDMIPPVFPSVSALASFDDGSGPALYIGGAFQSVGGLPARNIARWDGARWTALGEGAQSFVYALTVFDDGDGRALGVGGYLKGAGDGPGSGVARWGASGWSSLGGRGLDDDVEVLTVFDDGSGPVVYAGGGFRFAGQTLVNHVARWDGASWSALGGGVDRDVFALAVFDDGSGPALYAGGNFLKAGGQPILFIARWDGSIWSPVGSGLNNEVYTLLVADLGDGPALYAGGNFASRIARWDGTAWTPLGSGCNHHVHALAAFDDGSGLALYAGGDFTTAGGVSVQHVARWDGTAWSKVGAGLGNWVSDMVVHDDGSGPALYTGGELTGVDRWDGSAWSAVGAGPSFVYTLAVHDDGDGPRLVAGGTYASDGGFVRGVGRWDGQGWSLLGSGLSDTVLALASYDDGGGPSLLAGGRFGSALDSRDSYLARWGLPRSAWSSIGGGTVGSAGPPSLYGAGELTPGSEVAVSLVGGAPLSYGFLLLSTRSTPLPFVGGTLYAHPIEAAHLFGTDTKGASTMTGRFPGAPSGTALWAQVLVADPAAAPYGASLSNGVMGSVP